MKKNKKNSSERKAALNRSQKRTKRLKATKEKNTEKKMVLDKERKQEKEKKEIELQKILASRIKRN
jgi:hypothetical protein